MNPAQKRRFVAGCLVADAVRHRACVVRVEVCVCGGVFFWRRGCCGACTRRELRERTRVFVSCARRGVRCCSAVLGSDHRRAAFRSYAAASRRTKRRNWYVLAPPCFCLSTDELMLMLMLMLWACSALACIQSSPLRAVSLISLGWAGAGWTGAGEPLRTALQTSAPLNHTRSSHSSDTTPVQSFRGTRLFDFLLPRCCPLAHQLLSGILAFAVHALRDPEQLGSNLYFKTGRVCLISRN